VTPLLFDEIAKDYTHSFSKHLSIRQKPRRWFQPPGANAWFPYGALGGNPAVRDHVFITHKPVIFQEACRQAR
jgi:hypothetical protein